MGLPLGLSPLDLASGVPEMKVQLELFKGRCRCGQPARVGQRRCRACHAAYMREWRKSHPLTGEARERDNARHIAGMALKRGQIERKPCLVCGSTEKLEKHHFDYSEPLQVDWLCRKHHLALHHGQRLVAYDLKVSRGT